MINVNVREITVYVEDR